MATPLQGLIFDFDGTLAETVPLCIAAFREATEPLLGHPVTDEFIVSTFGPSEEGAVHRLVPHDPDACLELYIERYRARHDELAPAPFPDISAGLDELARNGFRLGLVTGKGPRTLAISMERHLLNHHFDEVRAGCAKGPCKAEKMKEILAVWGVPADSVAYVGDVPYDVLSARDAGCLAVSCAWASSANREKLAEANPDFLADTVAELVAWAKHRRA